MTLYNWLCLLGVPSLIAVIFGFIASRLKKTRAEVDAVKRGIQALLRDRLLETYQQAFVQGYADITVRENFVNMYNQYHNLGKNGVMDDIKDKFLDLPVR